MIKCDEYALICDFAETYNIYDIKSLPVTKVAIFAVGLGDNSRIKMKIRGENVNRQELLLAIIIDQFNTWLAANSDGNEKPQSMVEQLMGTGHEKKGNLMKFDSAEEFMEARRKAIEKGAKNGWNESRSGLCADSTVG